MKKAGFFFGVGFILFFPVASSSAQEPRERRERVGEPRSERGERDDRNRNRRAGIPDVPGNPPMGQPPGMPPMIGGQPGQPQPAWTPGGNQSGQSESERNERYIGMLKSMDTNGDGKLSQNEIPEYRRAFVSMVVSRMGGDPNKTTINIAELTQKMSSNINSPRPADGQKVSVGTETEPLVPSFGEDETAQTAILEFGQREAQAKGTVLASDSPSALKQSDQVLRSARDVMSKYDKNKNGTLDKDKGEWVSSLPFNADAADKNRDGRISMTELLTILGGKTGTSTGFIAVSTKQSAAYDLLPSGLPKEFDWFFEMDKDKDAQITMSEFANGKSWNETMADEFLFLDLNNDGVATMKEVLEALKRYDEEKRLKSEQAKRDIERRRGIAGEAVAVPPPLPDGQQPPATAGEATPTPVPSPDNPLPPNPPPAVSSTPTPVSTSGWRPSSAPASSTNSSGNSSNRQQPSRNSQRPSSRNRTGR
jgi:Ca2+-binding EF-hand superfamily protein